MYRAGLTGLMPFFLVIIIIINQVLRIIQIAVKSDIKTGRIQVLGNYVLGN